MFVEAGGYNLAIGLDGEPGAWGPGKDQKSRSFLLTNCGTTLICLSCDKRILQARDVLQGSGSSRSLVRFAEEVGFCLVPKGIDDL